MKMLCQDGDDFEIRDTKAVACNDPWFATSVVLRSYDFRCIDARKASSKYILNEYKEM